MRRMKSVVLWLMDVIVAVFIGPIENGKRARKVRRMANRRGLYAIGFACVMLLAAAVYAIATRWPTSGSM